jgi:hypothetical protein
MLFLNMQHIVVHENTGVEDTNQPNLMIVLEIY